jgi:outer membrane protein
MRIQILCALSTLLLFFSPSAGRASDDPPARGSDAKAKQVLQLSLKQAVDIALSPEGNSRVRMAEEILSQSRARRSQSLGALLPNLDATLSQQSQTRNLAAFGIQIQVPIPGFSFPTFVGPFNVFDVRATASQSLFDFSAIRRYQASKAGVSLAEVERESTQDQVRDQVSRTYLAALRAESRLETAKANVDLAEALLKLAQNTKSAGTGTGMEVTRAMVQVAAKKQQLLLAQNERTRAHLQLMRVLGLDLSATLELTEKLSFAPVAEPAADQAVRQALEARADWRSQLKRQETARLSHSAVKMERLPSLSIFGDYGSIGSGISNAIPTRTYGFQLRIPLFDGGRRDARRSEATSQFRQEEIRTRDLRAQIELEIRTALDNLRSAAEQVSVADEALTLSEKELAQAQRRYEAGTGINLEVTDAQTRLEQARENRILALFNHNLARIDLASAMGTIRQLIQ